MVPLASRLDAVGGRVLGTSTEGGDPGLCPVHPAQSIAASGNPRWPIPEAVAYYHMDRMHMTTPLGGAIVLSATSMLKLRGLLVEGDDGTEYLIGVPGEERSCEPMVSNGTSRAWTSVAFATPVQSLQVLVRVAVCGLVKNQDRLRFLGVPFSRGPDHIRALLGGHACSTGGPQEADAGQRSTKDEESSGAAHGRA